MQSFESRLVEQIPRLRRYARALNTDTQSADDLVQDTLERALNKKLLWRKNSRLRPWLFTIMHNLFINHIHRHGASQQMIELDDNIRDISSNPESDVYTQQLKVCIGRLPNDQKQIFLLVSLEGFAYEEVAKITGIPVGTVMSRLSRAREKLRRQIESKDGVQLRRVK